MLHQVNRLQLEATCANEAKAFEVRQNLSQTYQEQVAAVIDKVCTQHVSEEEWIKIDSIEIDLGHLTIQSYQDDFSSLLLEKFEKEFTKKISAIPPAEKAASKQIAFWEIIIYFLQTGTIPWWADNDTIDIDSLFIDVATEKKEQLFYFLQEQKFTAAIWQRIAMQFNKDVHSEVITFFPALQLAENKVQQWINFLAAQENETGAVINFNEAGLAKEHKFILLNAPLFFSDIKKNAIINQLALQFANEYGSVLNASITPADLAKKIMLYEQTGTGATNTVTHVAAEEIVTTEPGDTTAPELEEKFALHNAGTVLLAPYLKQLFTRLNLLQQGEWKDPAAHYKAIHLVRYMATGQLMCAEHTLVLEKLLCGKEITAPIPREVLLTEEEKTEAMSLLKAVIDNWEKLKNTSADGLRETFLKRDGILTKKENGWLLRVERKTVDVLLDTIPWSFATLAFAWNNYIIFTEW